MSQLEKITIAPGLTFDALTAGERGAPLVLLLHGFAESMHCWRAQIAALADSVYRAMAPSQRGYSPGARPDLAEPANYHIDRLMDDAMAIVAASRLWRRALSSGRARLGRQHRLVAGRSLSAAAGLAHRAVAAASRTPSIARCRCPTANRRAARDITRHSWNPTRPMSCWPKTQNGCASGSPPTAFPLKRSSEHLSVLGNKEAMEGALAWYRARGAIRGPLGPIRVPTLYIWGDADDTVGRTGRRRHHRFRRRALSLRGACPASAISRPTRCPIASASCCWRTSPSTRSERTSPQAASAIWATRAHVVA